MTLLVKNVRIIGGVREFPENTDLFVAADKISAIGNFPNKNADIMLDGQGAYLSPGFIDVNTDSDHYLTLFDDPGQEDFLKQGVTTIFGGMCGSSLAPLLYGDLSSFRKWTDTDRINVNWHTTAELLESIDHRPLAVNFGTMAGHSTIRRALIGEAIRDLSKNELAVFGRTLEGAADEGSYGLSTGLGYVHARKTPYMELKALADVIKKRGGIYATHLRDGEKGIVQSVEETIKLAKESGTSTLISHFIPVMGSEEEYQAALAKIESLPEDMDFNFDIYPSESTLFPVYTFLPVWAQGGGLEIMLANVKDEWLAAKIKKDLPGIDADHFFVAEAPGQEFLVGKSLREIQELYSAADLQDALLKLMVVMGLRGSILYKNLNRSLIRRAIQSRRSFIASNAPSFTQDHTHPRLKSERTTSTFTRFLTLVQKENLLRLPEAIRKITLEPARKFGLTGRGEIREGNFADLTCFTKDAEVKFTIVNGVLAMKEGEFQSVYKGRTLRHA